MTTAPQSQPRPGAGAVVCALCGVPLHRVACAATDEYVWADEAGHQAGPDADLAHLPDPYARLAELAAMGTVSTGKRTKTVPLPGWAIREYSALKVRLDMGGTHHVHHAVNTPAYTGRVLYCHSWPGWLRPSGWHCRVTGRPLTGKTGAAGRVYAACHAPQGGKVSH